MPELRRLISGAVRRSRPVIYLHVGAMKTGTTFVQHLMQVNRDNLLAAGFLVPGDRNEQGYATRDILGTAHKTPEMLALCEGVWARLAGQMFAHKGTASIFSHEFLSFADSEQAQRVVGSLEGADVHVILTVRDTSGALPSQWQTSSRNGGTANWPRFARSVQKGVRGSGPPRGQGARTFLRAQDIPRMLEVWGATVPPERLHVVTVPRSRNDPLLLWKRFARVVGVDPEVCSIPAQRDNPSLGYPSAELMRRINVALGKLPPGQYEPTLKAELATRILALRAPLEYPPALDLRTRRFAISWNRRVRRAIRASGAHLVGPLGDLPRQLPADVVKTLPKRLTVPTDEELLAAAETARDGLLALIQRREHHLHRSEANGVPPSDAPTSAQRWHDEESPVKAAVAELVALVRTAIDLDQQLKKTAAQPAPGLVDIAEDDVAPTILDSQSA